VTEATGDIPYFDVSDPSFALNSREVAAARDRSWYARTEFGLAILRYEEASALMKDRRLRQGSFSWPEQNGITEGLLADWWAEIVLSKEGEDHARLRRLVNPAFSPRLIKKMVPRFQALANELVDAFVDDGECEFVSQFAEPYAARVLTQLLGLPEDDWRQISEWSGDVGLAFGVTIAENLGRIEAALGSLYECADQLIVARRKQPGDDIVSVLVSAHDEGDRLSDSELRAMIAVLIFGGMDTTKNQLGMAMTLFVEHPEQWRLLAERPELAPRATEEVLRFNPTVTWTTRQTTEDMVFQGLEIEEGTTIHLFAQPASTDPSAIGEASFDITAERPPHFGFGGGAHHCLGHFLARIDMAEALALLARRLREPSFAGSPTFLPISGLTGPLELPIAFTSGANER
jgi:cytochrome P450